MHCILCNSSDDEADAYCVLHKRQAREECADSTHRRWRRWGGSEVLSSIEPQEESMLDTCVGHLCHSLDTPYAVGMDCDDIMRRGRSWRFRSRRSEEVTAEDEGRRMKK